MSIIICELDENNRWTGKSATIERKDPCPKRWIRTNPPENTPAVWNGKEWIIINAPIPIA